MRILSGSTVSANAQGKRYDFLIFFFVKKKKKKQETKKGKEKGNIERTV